MKKVTVISGGAGGLGKAAALQLGIQTAVVLGDRNPDALDAARKGMEDLGIEVYPVQVDIRDPESVRHLASFGAALGEVTNVIHTAGVSPANMPAEEIIRINALGTVNMVEAFFPILASGGVMINVASIAAHHLDTPQEILKIFQGYAQPGFFDGMLAATKAMARGGDEFAQAGVAYCLSKNFVIQFSKMNVARFASRGCRILSISPGSYLTSLHQSLIDNQPDSADVQLKQIPLNRWGHPYEFGALVTFLCSSGAAYINGVDILADGGQLSNQRISQI